MAVLVYRRVVFEKMIFETKNVGSTGKNGVKPSNWN